MCVSYCRQYNWTHGRAVLVRPYDATFMFYESMSAGDEQSLSAGDVFRWLADSLSQHIHVITSPTELQQDWLLEFHPTRPHTEHVHVIISLSDSSVTIPLFLSVLSPTFNGRVRFAQVTHSIASQVITVPLWPMSVVVSTRGQTYIYGMGDSECMTLDSLRLLLTLLAPSTADFLDFAINVSLFLFSVQPFLVFSGLKSRLICLASFTVRLCCLSLMYSFFVSYVIPEHELHLLMTDLLPFWQYLVLGSFGDLVRSDWLQYTRVNFGVFVVTYVLYLLLVGWLHHRLCSWRKALSSLHLSHEVTKDDDQAHIDWYNWQHFGEEDMWLQSPAGSGRTSVQTAARSCACCQQTSPIHDGAVDMTIEDDI